ncbi:VOC family protein [Brevibacillus dissolubilis]|uniref:VOC family protein n=1 Tax=Brevibacillus dissolubilis TaxID=1844116 RepID=UPI0011168C91|nr:VOC family protein [Brevibacillus dissolubilis]
MQLSMRYVILYVHDVAKSLEFYRDKLGLAVRADHDTYIELDTGAVILSLFDRGNARETTKLQVPEGEGSSQTFEVGFVTEDVEGTVNRLREQGVPVLKEPIVKPWGQTVAYVADPDGHYIEICTPMGS